MIITVFGFHGTSMAAAQSIFSAGFQRSSNRYDWLGDGAYFFQDAPLRAAEWATQHHGSLAAVVGAEIELDTDRCVDLLDIAWERSLVAAYRALAADYRRRGQRLPRQVGLARTRDRAVINWLVQTEAQAGRPVDAVRAAFTEGRAIFPRSALSNRSHVQIAVRNASVVRRMWREL